MNIDIPTILSPCMTRSAVDERSWAEEVDPLVVLFTGREGRGDDLHHVLGVPLEGDLLAVLALLHRGEGLLADEVVLFPADVEAVTQFERVDVVILDIVGDEAAADQARRLVGGLGEPLAVLLHHAVAGVDAGERRRDQPDSSVLVE
ncbi:MAG: hypothetical protein R3D80_03995 [Paracoccaceae bacterium]